VVNTTRRDIHDVHYSVLILLSACFCEMSTKPLELIIDLLLSFSARRKQEHQPAQLFVRLLMLQCFFQIS
jgi:hypothetical protein